MEDNKEIHIGKFIKKKMQDEGRKTIWLAEKIARTRSCIHHIYRQEHINPQQLIEISSFLKTNLFVPYFEYVNEIIQEKNSKM